MTIRDGGSPRDGGTGLPEPGGRRVRQAHPRDEARIDDDHYARARPSFDDMVIPRGRPLGRRGSGGGGLGGLLRLLVFIVVLAGVVLVASLTVLRPVIAKAVVDYASKNPSALNLPFVADFVREDLGKALTDAPSATGTEVKFEVSDGDTAQTIATRLETVGLLTDARSLVFLATEQGLATSLQTGTYFLRANMTPQQIVTSLLVSHQVAVTIGLREGLRLEQITAKLETVIGLTMDVKAFYTEVKHPQAALLGDYPWLAAVMPKGASLEGFLGAATYTVPPDITADEFVRDLLDAWYQQVGADLLKVPAARGLTFYQILSLASIVDHETSNDADRAKIAGVYQNRLKPNTQTAGFLQADPTVLYVHDSLALAKDPFDQWQLYVFWASMTAGTSLPTDLPADLAGFNTYASKGLIPGPISTPTVASIEAALNPDTKDDYLFFLSRKDGKAVFAKTYAEHLANIKKYGL